MLELGRREKHVTSGLVFQVIVVGVMVFAYTQAIRQVKYQREMHSRLTEQLAVARSHASKGVPDLEKLRAQVAETEAQIGTSQVLSEWAKTVETLAHDKFNFRDLQVKVGAAAEQTIPLKLDGRPPTEIQLQPLELEGASTTRNAAAFLARLSQIGSKVLSPLEMIEMEAQPADQPLPVKFHFKWLVAVSSAAADAKPPAPARFSIGVNSGAIPALTWGWREEPFTSVLVNPRAIRIPAATLNRFKLSGILWDATAPTCVINGSVLKPGDSVEGYRLVLIAQKAVILDGSEGEILLSLP